MAAFPRFPQSGNSQSSKGPKKHLMSNDIRSQSRTMLSSRLRKAIGTNNIFNLMELNSTICVLFRLSPLFSKSSRIRFLQIIFGWIISMCQVELNSIASIIDLLVVTSLHIVLEQQIPRSHIYTSVALCQMELDSTTRVTFDCLLFLHSD